VSVAVRTLRLSYSEFYVDARLTEVQGRWLASADTPDDPSVGTGDTPVDALMEALRPFEGRSMSCWSAYRGTSPVPQPLTVTP